MKVLIDTNILISAALNNKKSGATQYDCIAPFAEIYFVYPQTQ